MKRQITDADKLSPYRKSNKEFQNFLKSYLVCVESVQHYAAISDPLIIKIREYLDEALGEDEDLGKKSDTGTDMPGELETISDEDSEEAEEGYSFNVKAQRDPHEAEEEYVNELITSMRIEDETDYMRIVRYIASLKRKNSFRNETAQRAVRRRLYNQAYQFTKIEMISLSCLCHELNNQISYEESRGLPKRRRCKNTTNLKKPAN